MTVPFEYAAHQDSCRLAEYLEQEPQRKKAEADAKRAKLETLERKLGIDKSSGASSGGPADPSAGKKHRLDDSEFLEQSRDIVDSVKSAVAVGKWINVQVNYVLLNIALGLKKKKKAKINHSPTETTPPTESTSTPASTVITEKPAIEALVSTSSSAAVGA